MERKRIPLPVEGDNTLSDKINELCNLLGRDDIEFITFNYLREKYGKTSLDITVQMKEEKPKIETRHYNLENLLKGN